MEFFNKLREQLLALWQGWSTQQRVGIGGAAVGSLLLVLGTLYWATRAEYVVLASQLTPQRAAKIVGLLETAQIESQLNFSGSAVSVATSDVSKARLALKDVWDPVSEETSGASGVFPGSPSEEEDRRRRALEGRISRSIEQIRGIRSAIVHITMPDYTPFVVDQVATTASVVVDPTSPTAMTPAVAESITSLVARAVKGLTKDQISLMDTNGRQFNIGDGLASAMDGQFEFQRRVELKLASQAETMLSYMLGHDKAVVRVTASIDFRETTITDRKLDPDGKIKQQETIETITQTGGTLPAGEVGTATNVLPGNFQNDGNGSEYKREVIDALYDHPNTEEITRDIPGKIKRLTVAAIVDLQPPEPEEEGGEAPPPPADIAQIEAIIRQAVGFDEVRGDEIEVLSASLNPTLPPEAVPDVVATWERYEPLVQVIGKGLVVMCAFVFGLLVLKRMKPVVVTETPPPEPQMSIDDIRELAALSEQARENPEAAANVLAAWLGVEQPSEAESTSNSEEAEAEETANEDVSDDETTAAAA